jgi:hypothetical protein
VYPSSSRNLIIVGVPLLIAMAILGYLAGSHRATTSTGAAFGRRTRVVSVANVLLEYPADWSRTAGAAAIPGLAIAEPVLLAPTGRAGSAGLIAGQLPSGEPGPLPAGFLSLIHGVPHTEVLSFVGGQAYGYSRMSVAGYARTLELFVIPNRNSAGPTVLACYATPTAAAYLKQCAQIVAQFSLLGQSEYDLAPDAGYTQALSAAIGALERERLALRGEMAHAASLAAVSSLAASLAGSFSAAAAALGRLEPPVAASAAATALATALLKAHEAYGALASDARTGGVREHRKAMSRVDAAETGVDGALESFALLGYRRG